MIHGANRGKDRMSQDSTTALMQMARLAMERGDPARAAAMLEQARGQTPAEPNLLRNLGFAYLHAGRPESARAVLDDCVARFPEFHTGWLLLGQIREALGDAAGAHQAFYQAVRRAQQQGLWLDQRSTPPNMLQFVLQTIDRVRVWRRELFFASFAALREQYGNDELKRVDRALTGYLREWDSTPADPRQRPKFLFFPDLPSTPYLDPFLQPWARQLADAYPEIRAEAARVIAENVQLPGFLTFKEGDDVGRYLGGAGARPAWDAFFFYRRGRRYDDNHARCPRTSAVLESIELCRIRDQAPEICFSVLAPGTHIKPHHGVTNTRVVVHLPLIVPDDCALNIVDGDAHAWKEGELMMFDDSFQHEAWNRSDRTRVILLMDAWNPHLTEVEKLAVKQLVESISEFEGEARLA